MSRSAWYRLESVLVILLSFRNSTLYLILDVHRNPQTFLNSHSFALVQVTLHYGHLFDLSLFQSAAMCYRSSPLFLLRDRSLDHNTV